MYRTGTGVPAESAATHYLSIAKADKWTLTELRRVHDFDFFGEADIEAADADVVTDIDIQQPFVGLAD